ncbi:hypothetical protein Tco_1013116 [Tanacetum coccineum]
MLSTRFCLKTASAKPNTSASASADLFADKQPCKGLRLIAIRRRIQVSQNGCSLSGNFPLFAIRRSDSPKCVEYSEDIHVSVYHLPRLSLQCQLVLQIDALQSSTPFCHRLLFCHSLQLYYSLCRDRTIGSLGAKCTGSGGGVEVKHCAFRTGPPKITGRPWPREFQELFFVG